MKKGKKKTNNLFARITIFILIFFLLLIVVSMAFRFSRAMNIFKIDEDLPYTRVEVLNGCEVNDLAYKVALYLRENGFDVVEIANVKGAHMERTMIIERVDRKMRNAEVLGKVIDCSRMTAMIDSTLFLEVTLILGDDYKKYFSKEVLERKVF